MKRDREAQRAIHDKMRQQFDTMKQQPILDLNALHTAHQQAEQQNAQLREETAQAWLAFYNGLNDQQKTTVSTELKTRFERMEAHREKMRDRWEHRRGPASAPAAPVQQ
jgi:predicted  nucleic acid-binding Zn-ribbon protein